MAGIDATPSADAGSRRPRSRQTRGMTDDPLDLPDAPWAKEILDLVVAAEPAPIAHHSVRSFLFARVRAAHLARHR